MTDRGEYFLRYQPTRGEVVREFLGDPISPARIDYREWANGVDQPDVRSCSRAQWLKWTRHARKMDPDEFRAWLVEQDPYFAHKLSRWSGMAGIPGGPPAYPETTRQAN